MGKQTGALAMIKIQTAIFTATIFISAFLLFLVQPMFAKMMLPVLGGTSAVWTTCMVFFQATLLAGYGYAHALTKMARLPVQIGIHLTLLALALYSLPLDPPHLESSPDNPALWLLTFAVISIGLPFLVLSASAPLLQSWFFQTKHPHHHNPYFLYAASNIGSMVALLGYPFGMEAIWGLSQQRHLWTMGFGGLMIGLCLTAFITFAQRRPLTHEHTPEAHDDQGNPWSKRFFWMICAALPSSLMLGLTSFVSTDLAPISLFWVVPLALYLLTFIIVFGFGRTVPLKPVAWLVVALSGVGFVGFVSSGFYGAPLSFYALIVLHVLAFFFIAWFFHGQLALSKPSAHHLTDFYLWMSVGGMLGGVFNALVAPVAFRSTLEYPLVFLVAIFLIYKWLRGRGWTALPFNKEAVYVMILVFFVGLGKDLVFSNVGQGLYQNRSFYGSISIKRGEDSEKKRVVHVLSHGSTNHGAQVMNPSQEQSLPRGYYYQEGLFGEVMRAYALNNPAPANMGMIGLGSGAMATYSRAEDHLTFYEIDPMVVSIAQNPDYFTYWQQAKGEKQIVLGDARLKLAQAPDHHYDVLVVDAFSSDAIPVHLLTQEALALFLQKTKPTGAIAIHISNRYLDLEKVIANYTLPAGYGSYCGRHELNSKQDFKYPHILCLIAREDTLPAMIKANPSWKKTVPDAGFHPWTDDYSNIFNVFHQ